MWRRPLAFALVGSCIAGSAAAITNASLRSSSAEPPTAPLARLSSVQIVAPKPGARLKGVTTVRVRAPGGTQWVGIYACHGRSAGEDTLQDASGGWSVRWDTRMKGCANGPQELGAAAFTNAGDELGEAQIGVRIRNSAKRKPAPRARPCRASSVPRPIAHQGYKQRFGDCFGTLNRRVWCSHQWWESVPRVGTQYVDKKGVLHIVRRRADGYPNNTISTEPCGQKSPKSYIQGYFEARMRWTGVPGSGPAFWLLSTRNVQNPSWPSLNPYCARHGLAAALCYGSELDVFEGYGNHLNVFTGTLHRNTSSYFGVDDETNQNGWQPLASKRNLAARWHVYAAKWTAAKVSWYVDNRLIMSAPTFDSTNQPMHLLLYNWLPDWEPGNEISRSTPNKLQTEVDWVRVWQRR